MNTDIKRPLDVLQTLFADNSEGLISAQDLRDGFKSIVGNYYGAIYSDNVVYLSANDINVTIPTSASDKTVVIPNPSGSDSTGDTFLGKFYVITNYTSATVASNNVYISASNGALIDKNVVYTLPSNKSVLLVSNGVYWNIVGTTNLRLFNSSDIRFYDSDNSNYISLKSPTSLSADINYTLPSNDGTNGQYLSTDGSGILSWTSVSSTSNLDISTNNLLIPLYLPTSSINISSYDPIITLKRKYAQLGIAVVLNPTSGLALSEDTSSHPSAELTSIISKLKSSGIVVLGYNTSLYGGTTFGYYPNHTANTVYNRNDVATYTDQKTLEWYNNYPDIDGIFFDEVWNGYNSGWPLDLTSEIAWLVARKDYANSLGANFIIMNPGTDVDVRYFNADMADVIVIHESSSLPTTPYLDGTALNSGHKYINRANKGAIVHTQVDLDLDNVWRCKQYTSWFYSTNESSGGSGLSWSSLSNHLDEQARVFGEELKPRLQIGYGTSQVASEYAEPILSLAGYYDNNGTETYKYNDGTSATNYKDGLHVNIYRNTSDSYQRVIDLIGVGDQDGAAGGANVRILTNPYTSDDVQLVTEFSRYGTVGIGKDAIISSYLSLNSSTSAKSQINFTDGVSPSTPNVGDLWRVGNSLFYRNSSTTIDLLSATSASGGATSLDSLTDVTAPSPSVDDYLKWNGSTWINSPVSAGTVDPSSINHNGLSGLQGGVTSAYYHSNQNIDSSASPVFAGLRLTNLSASKIAILDGSSNISASNINSSALNYLDATSSIQNQIDTKVPYTGASGNVDLGTFSLKARNVQVIDSNNTNYLSLATGSALTSGRTLSLNTGDADRTLTINGNVTLNDWFNQGVKNSSSPSFLTVYTGNVGTNDGNSLNLKTNNVDRIVISSAGSIQFNSSYTFPTTSGSDGQYLSTNGSGVLSWTSVSGVSSLDSLTDVTAPSPGVDDYLKWNGSAWVNSAISAATINPLLVNHNSLSGLHGGVTSARYHSNQNIDSSASPVFAGLRLSNLNASKIAILDGSSNISASNTNSSALNYLDATSSIQTQLNTKFTQSGNSFGATGIIGTNDSYGLNLKTNNVDRVVISSTGGIQFNSAYTFPTSAGSNGQYLSTNGSGVLSWTSVSGVSSLDSLTDVTAPSPSVNDYLKWNGSAWVNSAVPTSSINHNGLSGLLGGVTSAYYHSNQNIDSSASPVFAGLTLSNLSASRLVITDASKNLASLTILPVANGGTNSSTALTNSKVMISTSGSIVESSTTTTTLGYLDATSSIQNQLNTKFTQSGNSFGATGIIGTNDSYGLNLKTNNVNRIVISSAGSIQFNSSYTFPTTSGTNGQYLSTNGSGVLSWTSVSGVSSLDSLTDVTAPSPSVNDYLKWNGSAWVNSAVSAGSSTPAFNYETVNIGKYEGSALTLTVGTPIYTLIPLNDTRVITGYIVQFYVANGANATIELAIMKRNGTGGFDQVANTSATGTVNSNFERKVFALASAQTITATASEEYFVGILNRSASAAVQILHGFTWNMGQDGYICFTGATGASVIPATETTKPEFSDPPAIQIY